MGFSIDEFLNKQTSGSSQLYKILIYLTFFVILFCLLISVQNVKKNQEGDIVPMHGLMFYTLMFFALYILYSWYGWSLYIFMIYGVVIFFA